MKLKVPSKFKCKLAPPSHEVSVNTFYFQHLLKCVYTPLTIHTLYLIFTPPTTIQK